MIWLARPRRDSVLSWSSAELSFIGGSPDFESSPDVLTWTCMFSFTSFIDASSASARPLLSSVAFLALSTLLTQKRLGMEWPRVLHLFVWRAPMKCQRTEDEDEGEEEEA